MINAQHSGRYGQGSSGFLDPKTYLANLSRIFATFPALPIISGSIIICLIVSFSSKLIPGIKATHRVLLSVLLANLAIIALASKSPAPQYLVPALSTSGRCILLDNPRVDPSVPYLAKHLLQASLNPLLTSSVLTTQALNTRVRNSVIDAAAASKASRFVEKYALTGIVISAYHSSSQAHALYFGNIFAAYRFTADLRKLYPNFYTYNIWGDALSRFGYESSAQDIQALSNQTLLHGASVDHAMLQKILNQLPSSVTYVELPDQAGEHFYILSFPSSTSR